MKKILLLVLCAVVLAACNNDDEKQLATIQVQAVAPTEMQNLDFTQLTLSLENITDGSTYSGTFDAAGLASFTVEPGRYRITASDIDTKNMVTYSINGLVDDITLTVSGVNGTADNKVTMTLTVGTASDIIFREIYFCGTKDASSANYNKDNYFELYNNSDHSVVLDGLCFGNIFQYNSTMPNNAWADKDTRAVGYGMIWMFPIGANYTLAPGASCVLAQNVKDHRTNAPSSVNLSGAHWAIYADGFTQSTVPPAGTPRLQRITAGQGSGYIPSLSSPAMVLFYLPMGRDAYVADAATYYAYEPGKTSGTKYWNINTSWIVDGVECMVESATIKTRRLPATVDAGYTYVTNGTYANKSVTRKVKETVNGRVVYQDTNNSTNDFTIDAPLNPKTK